jgi:hypothetical protein
MIQKKEIIQHDRVYELLPKPENSQQFTELLNWLKEDRQKVFAHAKFSTLSRYIFMALMVIVATILVFATSERAESAKWFLKLFTSFIK